MQIIYLVFLFGLVFIGLAFVACEPESPARAGMENGKFKKSYAEAIDAWTSPDSTADKSLVTWLRVEAETVCRMLRKMVNEHPDPAGEEATFQALDPDGFCKRDPGMDPTRMQPKEPEQRRRPKAPSKAPARRPRRSAPVNAVAIDRVKNRIGTN